MGEAERRRQVLADSAYLEAHSRALIIHSQELIAEARQLRARLDRLWKHNGERWEQRDRRPIAVGSDRRTARDNMSKR